MLFELLVEHIPAPEYTEGHPFQALVANLDASPYVGRLAICRVHQGWVHKGDTVAWCRRPGGQVQRVRIAELYLTEALQRVDAGPRGAGPGDIMAVAGIPEIMIGDTLADATDPRPRPGVTVDEPAISMTIGINTSPLAGKEGTKVTARLVKGRLDSELVGNVSIRVLPTDRPDTWEVQGRGELALAVLVELMRREGFELTVGKPQVLTKLIDGKVYEPVERVSLDIPDEHLGTVTQLLAGRKGRMQHVVSHGSGWARTDWLVPSRALIGLRSQLLTETKGTAQLHHVLDGWEPWCGEIRTRQNGSLVADRRGKAATYALHESARTRHPFPRAGHRGLRRHGDRRERPPGRHGREPHQRAQAHQYALVDGRGAGAAVALPRSFVGTGPRVLARGRMRRGNPAIGAAAQSPAVPARPGHGAPPGRATRRRLPLAGD